MKMGPAQFLRFREAPIADLFFSVDEEHESMLEWLGGK